MTEAYVQGFISKCAEFGLLRENAENALVKQAKGAYTKWYDSLPRPIRERIVEVARKRLMRLVGGRGRISPENFWKNGINDWRVVNGLIGERNANVLRRRMAEFRPTYLPIKGRNKTRVLRKSRVGMGDVGAWSINPETAAQLEPRVGKPNVMYFHGPEVGKPGDFDNYILRSHSKGDVLTYSPETGYRSGFRNTLTPLFEEPKILRESIEDDIYKSLVADDSPIDIGVSDLSKWSARRTAARNAKRELVRRINSGEIILPDNIDKKEFIKSLNVIVPGAVSDIRKFNSAAATGKVKPAGRGKRIDRNNWDAGSGISSGRYDFTASENAVLAEDNSVPGDFRPSTVILAALRRPDGSMFLPGHTANHEVGHLVSQWFSPIRKRLKRPPKLAPYGKTPVFWSPVIAEERAANYFGKVPTTTPTMDPSRFETDALASYYLGEAKTPEQYRYILRMLRGK